MIKVLIIDSLVLIAQIEEVGSELGEPDCKLINPFCVNPGTGTLIPWLSNYTSQSDFMIHSDKILTIAEPNTKLLERYQTVTE